MDINIRKATQKDLPAIFDLVKELAAYENGSDQVTATLQDYENAFNDNIFESQVAEYNGKVIGMTLYYMTYSTWRGKMLYLEDFVISEKHRNKGVGQLLFDAFLKEAKSKKAAMVKWQVLDWNEPAIKFYEKNNAIIDKDWWNVKMIFDQ